MTQTIGIINGQRLYNDYFRQIAYQNLNGWTTGVAVSQKSGTPNMSVDVSAGVLFFDGIQVNVLSQNVVLGASHASFHRFDLIVCDATGTCSVIAGTPSAQPKPSDVWDPSTQFLLARVDIPDLSTQIFNANIADMRIKVGGGGASGGTVLRAVPVSGVTNGQAVRWNGANFVPAQANSVANSAVVGIVKYVSGLIGDVYIFGTVDFLTGLTNNQTYYLDATTAGALTTSPPAIAVKMGVSTSTTKLILDIDRSSPSVGRKFVQSFVSQTNITITHAMNDSDVIVQVYDSSNELVTPNVVTIIDANNVNLQFTPALTGKVVIISMTGFVAAAGITSFYSMNFTTQTTVVVNHNLNQQYVVVQAVNSSDQMIDPASVTLNSANQCTVTFAPAQTGRIVVVGGATFVSVGGSGDIIPNANNAYNIGSPSFKWLNGYFGGAVSITGNITNNMMFLGLQASDPGSPSEGQVWYNSTDKQFKGYNGTSVVILG